MTAREKLQDRGLNINTLLIIVGLITGGITIHKFAAPVFSNPERTAKVEQSLSTLQTEVSTIKTGVTVQTESLKVLTTLASEANESGKKLERHAQEILDIKRRLDRLEPK